MTVFSSWIYTEVGKYLNVLTGLTWNELTEVLLFIVHASNDIQRQLFIFVKSNLCSHVSSLCNLTYLISLLVWCEIDPKQASWCLKGEFLHLFFWNYLVLSPANMLILKILDHLLFGMVDREAAAFGCYGQQWKSRWEAPRVAYTTNSISNKTWSSPPLW